MLTKKELRRRRFVAKYVKYLTVFGYIFVVFVAVAVAVLWFVKVDEVVSAGGEIKPAEKTLKHEKEVVVLKVLVPNHADVTEGQGLVEICDDPEWVARYRALPEKDSERREELRNEMPGRALPAPRSGVAVLGKDPAGNYIPAWWDIAKVIDFNDLKLSADVGGKNVIYVLEGQRVKVEPLPTYGNEEILRSDIDYPGWWRKGRAQFNSVGEGKIKGILQEYFATRPVALEDEEDAPFRLSEVEKVELQGVLRVEEPLVGEERSGVEAEPFIGTMLEGYVHKAEHRASVKLRNLPDEVMSAIEEALLDRFQDGVRVNSSVLSIADSLRSEARWDLLEGFRGGLREDDAAALSVAQIEGLRAVVTMEARIEEAEDDGMPDAEPFPAEKTERKCRVVVKFRELPPGFRAKVRELALAERPKYIPAEVKVVVGGRRIAMLLFRKN